MSDWEFLLQKEGDQTWLPLELADVEILEGRYRIVANTHIANTEVQIQIIHNSNEEIPPIRRVHKRSSRTRSQGLISIIPFTRLKPGKWEFRCLAKPTTSSIETREHIVYLEVLSNDWDSSDFSQQLEPQSQELYKVKDTEPELKNLITNENISFFSGQNEVTINQEENIGKNYPELPKLETIKSDEIELLDSQIQEKLQALSEESESIENLTDLLDSYKQQTPNIQNQNEEIKNIESQLRELTETLNNSSSILEELQKEPDIKVEENQETNTNTQANSILNLSLELILDRLSYIAQPGEALTISGQIIIDNQDENIQSNEGFNNLLAQDNLTEKNYALATNNTPIINGNLNICLRNPQTSEILIEVEQILPEQALPIFFACIINVPENMKTRLILGEIILKNNNNVLANQSFTITASVENLLAVIDDNFWEDEYQEIVDPKTNLIARKPEEKHNSFQDLVKKINQTQPEQKTDREKPLPPQINKPITGKSNSEILKLPTFGNSLPDNSNRAKNPTKINDLAKSNYTKDSDEMDDVWRDSEPSEEETNLQSEVESKSETFNKEATLETKQNLVPFPTNFTPINHEFKALNLEDRFFSRLNSLINDSELLQWMKISSVEPTEKTDKGNTELDKTEELQDNDSISVMVDDEEFASEDNDEINWEAEEFVVEDEQPEEIWPGQENQWDFGLDNLSQQKDESISTKPYILSDEQPLPVPNLELMAKDIVAGRAVKVRVKLPEGLPRIYVKIWVYDRQAQAIVAGPRWLTDFIPNGMGEVEVITDLDIAYGCLEIRFEAIAAEVQTDRESHKAVVECLVVPPPPPKLPFDNG
ncbi:hypothetical protein [Okeania sp.]|uniref:hypothetical protein n=1 Tax=Okeania sp. TaxID=3100323 RepID=UPI002B4B3CD4|nr:hypothetical protein [Okeania sp.]MEB3341997.1 hypothetical protein [Okeania sp.]